MLIAILGTATAHFSRQETAARLWPCGQAGCCRQQACKVIPGHSSYLQVICHTGRTARCKLPCVWAQSFVSHLDAVCWSSGSVLWCRSR